MNSAVRRFPVLAEDIWPTKSLLKDIVLIFIGSLVVGLSAQIKIPIWPVPITGQTFGALLVGIVLGKNRGLASLLAYLIEGIMGLPFFAGGSCGFAILVGPTGGYLIGMTAAAYVIGFLSERGFDRKIGTTVSAMFLGNLIIYIFGLPWLAFYVGWQAVLQAGFFPFIAGDLAKLVLAALLFPYARSFIKTRSHTGEDEPIY